jgi:hypothetical protein
MATNAKLNELVTNGIGHPKERDSRIHIHYDINMFKHATNHNGLVLVEANGMGKYTSPPCKWVERNMPNLKTSFLDKMDGLDRNTRISMLGQIVDTQPYRYNAKSYIGHGLFSFSHGSLPKGRSHYSWRNMHEIVKNAAEIAQSFGLKDIFIPRVYGGLGGVLFSNILDDTEIALGDLDINIHFFVPKDPDQGPIGV